MSGASPGEGGGGGSEVPKEIKDMLAIACNPPALLLRRRPRFAVVRRTPLECQWPLLMTCLQMKQPWKMKVRRASCIAIQSTLRLRCFVWASLYTAQASESLWEMEGGMFKASPLVDICNGNDTLRPHKKEHKVPQTPRSTP